MQLALYGTLLASWLAGTGGAELQPVLPDTPESRSEVEASAEPQPAAAGEARPTLKAARGWIGAFGGALTAGAEGQKGGGLFGGSGAFYFTRHLGVEVGVERHSLDVVGTPANGLSGGSLESIVVTGGVLVRFPVNPRVVPYVAGGLAYFSNSFEVDPAVVTELSALNFRVTEELEGKLGFNVGAGLDVRFSSRFALFGEARYLAASTNTKAELADTVTGTAAGDSGSQDLNRLAVRAGIRFVF